METWAGSDSTMWVKLEPQSKCQMVELDSFELCRVMVLPISVFEEIKLIVQVKALKICKELEVEESGGDCYNGYSFNLPIY